MNFNFQVKAGFIYRSQIRNQFENSKQKLMFEYPGSNVLITESKGFTSSIFTIQGRDFPETVEPVIRGWYKQIESIANAN